MTSHENPFDIVILGAGAPHSGETPAVLRETSVGKLVLDWLAEAYAVGMQDLTFVAGYQAAEVRQRYPDLRVIDNPDWQNTGSLQSLLLAKPDKNRPLFVNYGDVLIRKTLIDEMDANPASVVIAIDSTWRARYAPETARAHSEREKVSVLDGHATRVGYDMPLEWADGEFIGVVRLSPAALAKLADIPAAENQSTKTSLSDAVEYLRARGEEVAVIDTQGDWVEVVHTRDIAYFVLGTKADTLLRLRGVLKSGTIQDVASFTVQDWQHDKDAVMAAVRAQMGSTGVRLVVRSSARSEDTFTSSNAGGYDSVLNVDPDAGLAPAVEQVIASYHNAAQDDQILVQPMLQNVVLSGVAFTRTVEHYAPWYVINYETSGGTDGVTSGTSADHLTLHVRRGAVPDVLPMPELDGVIAAIEEIETRLGYDALDIEFAVDTSGEVHVFQVRPIAIQPHINRIPDAQFDAAIAQAQATWARIAPTPPHIPGDHAPIFGVMPDWNPAEIIGTAPGALAETLYRYLIMDEVWATQRAQYGYRDVRPAPLLVGFAGRPYVDVRSSFTSFIPACLDDDLAGRLLGFYLGWLRTRPALHDKVEFDVLPTCLAADFPAWEARLTTEGGFSTDEVAQLRSALGDITAQAFERCAGDLAMIDKLEESHGRIMAADLDPLERARLLLEDCRRFGTLPFAHLARSGFVAVTLLRGAENTGAISEAARTGFLTTIRTVSHSFTEDAAATAAGTMEWDDFVEKYGHLRPGTYDIVSPRYNADPEFFLRPQVTQAANAAHSHDGDTGAADWARERPAFLKVLSDLGLPDDVDAVETFLKQAIEGREYAKFVFSRNLSDALEALAEAGATLGLTRDTLANLPLSSLLALRDTSTPVAVSKAELQALAQINSAAREQAGAIKLPPLITGLHDIDAFMIGAEVANFVGQGQVIAKNVDLEHAEHDVENLDLKGCIVMIPQADPGYDWLFGQGIVGLVTMYGGVNSHMAIRAAEFGMAAAIGVGEKRYREIAGAAVLQLDPRNQVLKVVS